MSTVLDLGHGHRFTFAVDGTEKRVGGIHEHPRKDGPDADGETECGGAITFRGCGDGPQWDVVSEEPLTLSPSLLCRRCGSHGFIRNGVWEEA